ncbi:hypothetical protein J3458_022112 [Metarhizium acridum]|uniref:uncharacterized protein n=1 Tax=Metarhizium acridum TaxID=92637 RepID=UPI001C6AF03E|nr:hypothetical protein J3458_022112 [Metarhizium acridum]
MKAADAEVQKGPVKLNYREQVCFTPSEKGPQVGVGFANPGWVFWLLDSLSHPTSGKELQHRGRQNASTARYLTLRPQCVHKVTASSKGLALEVVFGVVRSLETGRNALSWLEKGKPSLRPAKCPHALISLANN